MAAKRKVGTKPAKTAKKAVKKEVAKKAPAKKAVVKKPRARNNHKVGAASGFGYYASEESGPKKEGKQAGQGRQMGETKTAFAQASGEVD